jgi:hypothetical protein
MDYKASADRRAQERREHHLGEGRGAGDQPLPVLQEDLGLRRAQPALARDHPRASVDGFVWLEELIELAEEEASCELFGILKRPDEKWVTERAYDNPKFVEDLVRDIAVRLNADERIRAYTVESENFESIHNHSAYAMIERDKERGRAAAPLSLPVAGSSPWRLSRSARRPEGPRRDVTPGFLAGPRGRAVTGTLRSKIFISL